MLAFLDELWNSCGLAGQQRAWSWRGRCVAARFSYAWPARSPSQEQASRAVFDFTYEINNEVGEDSEDEEIHEDNEDTINEEEV